MEVELMIIGNKTMKSFIAILIMAAVMISGSIDARAAKGAKYVFFFIGDGMGIPQRTAAEQFTGKKLLIDTMPAQGITTTYANDRFITGSAASATALASGQKTNINYIGVDPNFKAVKTVAEMAKEQGKKVGIVSSVSIDHATPAAFYAHVKTRKMYHEIDCALANSGFDFFGGGGLKDPAGKKSKKPLGDALKMAKDNGYRIINNKRDFMALKPGDGKVLAWNEWLQDGKAMPYVMDMTDKDITLPEFTGKAIEMLDNDKGFFLMVEGGKIDWACHANDATASLINTRSFDDSVKVAMDFYKKHPDETLIIVTGDHECGGLTLGFAGTKYSSNFKLLNAQKTSFQKFSDEIIKKFKADNGANASFNAMKPIITANFGLKFEGDAKADPLVLAPYEVEMVKASFDRSMRGDKEGSKDSETYLLYGEYEPLTVSLTHILNNKAGLAWTSYKHTGVPVSTSAIGVGSEAFNGYYDNTDVAKKVMSAMGIAPRVYAAK
ncbi:alkaline phosphatase [Pseudodesulfovibrio senegalensis]|uniref:Alkaline phosphatase n=2 Tax=Pseudodesulfovibrio senegalensis TaxID=1721087 RepID=A0A6N6N5W1_9BACT|nr:alkaline phosphatase [Pseudodesulfovibrio senegalensis]